MPARSPRLRTLHASSALVIGLFLLLHIANHLVGLAGREDHIAFMAAIRPLYRNLVVEPVLLFLLAFQIVSGVTMVVRGWRGRTGAVAWLQAGSGLYLAAFLTIHVASVLSGRLVLGLDTNFDFAAAGFHVGRWYLYFAPYYFLAVAALFTHIGCALYWILPGNQGRAGKAALAVMTIGGSGAALAIVLALGGALYPVDIPDRYRATYRG